MAREKYSGIYMIRNKANGKYYIGSSCNVQERVTRHRRALRGNTHHSIKLQRAWNKYGEHAFTFELLCCCEREKLIVFEQIVLDLFEAATRGYNVYPTAASPKGYSPTEEQRLKMRTAQLGRTHSDETRQKISESNMGKVVPPCSPELRAKRSLARTGKKVSEETRCRMRDAALRREQAKRDLRSPAPLQDAA